MDGEHLTNFCHDENSESTGGKGVKKQHCSLKSKLSCVALGLQAFSKQPRSSSLCLSPQHHLGARCLQCEEEGWSLRSGTLCCSSLSQAFKDDCVLLVTTCLCGGAEKARDGSVSCGHVLIQSLQGSILRCSLPPSMQTVLFCRPLSSSLGDTKPQASQRKLFLAIALITAKLQHF